MAERRVQVEYFVDTWFWVAFINKNDDHHARAVAIEKKLKGSRLVTSQMVLTELLNFFAGLGSAWRAIACDVVNTISENRNVRIVEQFPEQFTTSVEKYRKFADKEWSLTDCSSFITMEQDQIKYALTADKHFEQAGFLIYRID